MANAGMAGRDAVPLRLTRRGRAVVAALMALLAAMIVVAVVALVAPPGGPGRHALAATRQQATAVR